MVLLRPFNVGDFIDADGIVGTVVEIGLFATQMRTYDGVYMFAPNSKLSNAKIINYSREQSPRRRTEIQCPRSADIGQVRESVVTGFDQRSGRCWCSAGGAGGYAGATAR